MKTFNKKRMLKNKRGEDMLVDFVAIAVFAVIVLGVFVAFWWAGKNVSNNISDNYKNKDVNFMLESFMKAPALSIDPKKTVADIITEDSIKDNFVNTEKLFKEYFNRTNIMNNVEINDITISIKGKNSAGIKITKSNGAGAFGKYMIISFGNMQQNTYNAETYIPWYEGKVYVRLELSELVWTGNPKNTGTSGVTNNGNAVVTPSGSGSGGGSVGGVKIPTLTHGH